MSQAYADGVATSAYVENYLDFVENLPQEIQRFITRFHEIEISYMTLINEIATHREVLEKEDGDFSHRRRTLLKLEKTLIKIQELGDEKVEIGQQINDFIDYKYRSLDHDLRNLDLFKDNESSDTLKDSGKDASSTGQGLSAAGSGGGGASSGIGALNLNASNSSTAGGGGGGLGSLSGNTSGDKQNGTNGGSSGNGGGVSGNPSGGGGSGGVGGSGGGSNNNERASKRARRTRAEQEQIESSPIETRGSVGGLNSGSGSSSKQATGGGGGSSGAGKGSGSTGAAGKKKKRKCRQREESPPREEELPLHEIDEPTYCLCDQISYGEMILCDNDLCPIEWFHFVCVSLTTKPKGKWFCPKCRGDRPNVMKPKSQFLKELERYNKEKEEKA